MRSPRRQHAERPKAVDLAPQESKGVFHLEDVPAKLWTEIREWVATNEWVRTDDCARFMLLSEMAGRSSGTAPRTREWIEAQLNVAETSRGDLTGTEAMLGYVADFAAALVIDPDLRQSESFQRVQPVTVAQALFRNYKELISDSHNQLSGRASFGPADIPWHYMDARAMYPDQPDVWTLSEEQRASLLTVLESAKPVEFWHGLSLAVGMRALGIIDSVDRYIDPKLYVASVDRLSYVSGAEPDAGWDLRLMWLLALASAKELSIQPNGLLHIVPAEPRSVDGTALPPRAVA